MQVSIFVFKVALIIVLSWFLSLFTPWWSFAIVAFLLGIILQKSALLNFFSGLLGGGLYYFLSGLWIGTNDNFEFANKVAAIFSENIGIGLSGYGLLWIGTLLFAFIAALSSLSGALLLSPQARNRLQDSRRTKARPLKLDL